MLVSSASAAFTRVPDSKSMPKLSCWVANAIAPIARITPDAEKKYFDIPVKSNPHSTSRSPAPRNRGERRKCARPSTARTACVNRTAVNSETIVPMPSVNAKPLTPALASTKRMNAVIRVMTFASMIVAMPLR